MGSVVVGDWRPLGRCAGGPVVPDRGGHGEQPLGDPGHRGLRWCVRRGVPGRAGPTAIHTTGQILFARWYLANRSLLRPSEAHVAPCPGSMASLGSSSLTRNQNPYAACPSSSKRAPEFVMRSLAAGNLSKNWSRTPPPIPELSR